MNEYNYSFNVVLRGYESKIWRTIVINDQMCINDLIIAIICSMGLNPGSYKSVHYLGNIYNIFDKKNFLNQSITSICFKCGDKLVLKYGLDGSFIFDITLLNITNSDIMYFNNYPIVTDGNGDFFPQDISINDLKEIIAYTDTNNMPAFININCQGNKLFWDYRCIDIDKINRIIEDDFYYIKK